MFQKSLYRKPDMKTTYLTSFVLQKLLKICERVLAPSPTIALTHKHVSTRLNKFKIWLQFVTKQNYSFILGKATFGTHCMRQKVKTYKLQKIFTLLFLVVFKILVGLVLQSPGEKYFL
jgi:hypothetical protein